MSGQGDLFGEAYARGSDPDTSHAAAGRVDATKLERLTLNVLRAAGVPMTSKEIARRLGMEWSSITPRLAPLERKRLVIRTGERRDKMTLWSAA